MDTDIFPRLLWQLGPIEITDTLTLSVCLSLLLWCGGWALTRRLSLDPGPVQTALEGVVVTMETTVRELVPQHVTEVAPFIMGLWWFLLAANLIGLIPGLQSPTRDLSVTSSLAFLVFLSVPWFGIRSHGLKRYLSHYVRPFPFLLPFHIVGEITRTLALAVRLFGNMMSLDLVALIFLLLAGFLVPVPILMLHMVEALVQAYIFGMLALVYIAGGIQSQSQRESMETEEDGNA